MENPVNRLAFLLLLTASIASLAQAPQITKGAAVFIEPMGGYETYLVAAMMKKHVPLLVVTDRDKADYIITGTFAHKDIPQPAASQPTVVVNNNNTNALNGNATSNPPLQRAQGLQDQAWAEKRALGETDVTLKMVDPRTSQVVFADTQDAAGNKQIQKTAEACANHLLEFIGKKK
jgi:hypothetical protein